MSRLSSDARALSFLVEGDHDEQRPSFASSGRRRSSSYFRGTSPSSSHRSSTWRARMMKTAGTLRKQGMQVYNKLTPLQRVLAIFAGVIVLVLGILFLVFNERIFHMLVPYAQKWRSVPAGWLVLWAAIFIVSFPPLIGYSSLLTISGFLYGFPNSWFLVASATIVGSTCSFLVSRSILKNHVNRLVSRDPRFTALALTLKHDGIKILIMIRLCPLPYSISNGALATVPTVQWPSFMLATAISSIKLLLHVFIGARVGEIAEHGGEMDTKTKILSYLTIVIGGLAGAATGWIIYRQTKARARELEAEERSSVRGTSVSDLEDEYADDPAALEAAELLREDGDDISLHSSIADDVLPYRDEGSEEDVFKTGDGDEEHDRGVQK